MNIKKTSLAILLLSATIGQAIASPVKEYDLKFRPSVSLGYEQAHVQGLGNLQGVNGKIQYNSDYPWGFMASVSYLKDQWDTDKILHRKSGDDKENGPKNGKENKTDYLSFMIGPTIKINEITRLYALAGMSQSHINPSKNSGTGKDKKNHFAYGAGITTNLTDRLVLTAGYEGSQIMIAGKNKMLNGGAINIGYQF